jgi:hypothetical protein
MDAASAENAGKMACQGDFFEQQSSTSLRAAMVQMVP